MAQRISRQRIEELQAGFAALKRELASCEEGHALRYRDLEREKEAGAYELRRLGEKLSAAEAWRAREAERSSAAEGRAETALAEMAELKAKLAHKEGEVENAVAPLRREKTTLESVIKEKEIQLDILQKEMEHQKKQAEIEYSQLRTEVEASIPGITAMAVKKTEEECQRRLDLKMQQFRVEAQAKMDGLNQTITSLKSALVETQAKAHSQSAVDRANREALEAHVKTVLENLETENKGLKGELERSRAAEGRALADRRALSAWEDANQDSALHAIQAQVSTLQDTCRQLAALEGAGGRGNSFGVLDGLSSLDSTAGVLPPAPPPNSALPGTPPLPRRRPEELIDPQLFDSPPEGKEGAAGARRGGGGGGPRGSPGGGEGARGKGRDIAQRLEQASSLLFSRLGGREEEDGPPPSRLGGGGADSSLLASALSGWPSRLAAGADELSDGDGEQGEQQDLTVGYQPNYWRTKYVRQS